MVRNSCVSLFYHSSLMAEVVWRLEATLENLWEDILSLNAYTGQHEGVGGSLCAAYHFWEVWDAFSFRDGELRRGISSPGARCILEAYAPYFPPLWLKTDMRIEGNCKYDEALPSATNTRKIIFRVQAPKRQEIFLSLFYIAGNCRRGTGRAARILYDACCVCR